MVSGNFASFVLSLMAWTVHLGFRAPCLVAAGEEIRNERPIIGILTLEADLQLTGLGKQYMSAHYVKLVESGGARAMPIFINSTEEQIAKIFSHINGVILPGGHAKLNESNYTRTGKQIFELAKQATDEGKIFPIWAECLGLELLALLVAERNTSLGQYDETFFEVNYIQNISLPLQLAQDYRSSSLLSKAPSNVIEAFKYPLYYNNHVRSLMLEDYENSKKLGDFFRVVGTSEKGGKKFVALMEGRKHPFYLFHFHPSKPLFEWSTVLNVKHSQKAILTSQHFINFFINQARMNENRFPSKNEEKAALIYNYSPTYTGDIITVLQTYLFD